MNKLGVLKLLFLTAICGSMAHAAGPAPAPGNPRVSDVRAALVNKKPTGSFVFQWDPVSGAPEYQVIVPGCQDAVSMSGSALPPASGGMKLVKGPPYAVKASGCRCSLVDPRVVTVPVKPAYTKFSAVARPAAVKFPNPCPQ